MNSALGKKTEIRKRILSLRLQAGAEQVMRCSGLISERVLQLEAFRQADTVFAYMDCRKEVQTGKLIRAAWEEGKRVAVPKVQGDTMDFYYIRDFSEVHPGCFRVPEPAGTPDTLAAEEHALILVPGVAFDSMRNRLGYGKGYYDKYLTRHPGHPTIALAFSWQMTEQIPCGAHDVRPDCLVTEERIYI